MKYRKEKIIHTCLLFVALLLFTAFGEKEIIKAFDPEPIGGSVISIQKEVIFVDKIPSPELTFTILFRNPDINAQPAPAIPPITVTVPAAQYGAEGNVKNLGNGLSSVLVELQIDLNQLDIDWDVPGSTYIYKVIENQIQEPRITDGSEYINREAYHLVVTTEGGGNSGYPATVSNVQLVQGDNEKVTALYFSSVVEMYEDFMIMKTIDDESPLDQTFTFTLTMTPHATANYSAYNFPTKILRNGSSDFEAGPTLTIEKESSGSITFTLGHGDRLFFIIWVGTGFTVTERAETDWQATEIHVFEAGEYTTYNGEASRTSTVSGTVQYEAPPKETPFGNGVKFENTYHTDIVPTGVILNNLPYIILLLLSIVGLLGGRLYQYHFARR